VSDDGLKLRPMSFDGVVYYDDWLVIWRGLSVGRILKQSGVAWGAPDWYWGINFGHRPQTGKARLAEASQSAALVADMKANTYEQWLALPSHPLRSNFFALRIAAA